MSFYYTNYKMKYSTSGEKLQTLVPSSYSKFSIIKISNTMKQYKSELHVMKKA